MLRDRQYLSHIALNILPVIPMNWPTMADLTAVNESTWRACPADPMVDPQAVGWICQYGFRESMLHLFRTGLQSVVGCLDAVSPVVFATAG